jgi:hypothetical protein
VKPSPLEGGFGGRAAEIVICVTSADDKKVSCQYTPVLFSPPSTPIRRRFDETFAKFGD